MKTIDENLPVHYRVVDCSDQSGVSYMILKFYPIRETKCFYYLVDECDKWALTNFPDRDPRKIRKVGKNSHVRYCYPTVKEAMTHYVYRKRKQIQHLNFNLAVAKKVSEYFSDENGKIDYAKIELVANKPTPIKLGLPDYFRQLNWIDF